VLIGRVWWAIGNLLHKMFLYPEFTWRFADIFVSRYKCDVLATALCPHIVPAMGIKRNLLSIIIRMFCEFYQDVTLSHPVWGTNVSSLEWATKHILFRHADCISYMHEVQDKAVFLFVFFCCWWLLFCWWLCWLVVWLFGFPTVQFKS